MISTLPQFPFESCSAWLVKIRKYKVILLCLLSFSGVHHPHPGNAARGILVDVFYIDYGNSETISAYSIRSLHRKFSETPPQAMCCSLAEVCSLPFRSYLLRIKYM